MPFSQIPPEHVPLYEEAEQREWASWVECGCVRVVFPDEAQQVLAQVDPRRVIGLRFVYRDKNSAIRTAGKPAEVKAKARLCAQASSEPGAVQGLVKLDSPTAQRLGVMLFIQFVLNHGWVSTWRKGDISTAFLQGKDRDTKQKRATVPSASEAALEGSAPGGFVGSGEVRVRTT